MSDEKRYCFKRDDDGYDYLIPLELRGEFDRLHWKAYREGNFHAFKERFSEMKIGYSIHSSYSFVDPKPIRY